MNMGAHISSMTASIVATYNIGIGFCNADIFAIILILILLLASVFIYIQIFTIKANINTENYPKTIDCVSPLVMWHFL